MRYVDIVFQNALTFALILAGDFLLILCERRIPTLVVLGFVG